LLTVKGGSREFVWTDFSSGDDHARQMTLPALGWRIFYAVRQNELIFADSEELIKEILSTAKTAPKTADAFERLTVIAPDNGRDDFKTIFGILENAEVNSTSASDERFFTGNIG